VTATARTRLGPTGSRVLVGAVLVGGLGFWVGYVELVAIGLCGLLAVALAVVVPRAGSPMRFHRHHLTRLVQRGATIQVSLEAEADRATPPVKLIDQLAGATVVVDCPQVAPGHPAVMRYRLRALRRGAYRIGPVLEERTDPFGLVTRTVRHDVFDEILVHPVVHSLELSSGGSRMRQARAIIPRFSEDPLADFRSLREYVTGDDARLVHWTSTAKTGTLMVRDHFELRRTARMVILETLDRTITDSKFEEAVEIAASLVCSSLSDDITVIARTRDRAVPGHHGAVRTREEALELFSRVTRTPADHTVPVSGLRMGTDAADQIFVVTGPSSPFLHQMMTQHLLSSRLVVIRVHEQGDRLPRLPVRHVDVTSAEQLLARWHRRRAVRT